MIPLSNKDVSNLLLARLGAATKATAPDQLDRIARLPVLEQFQGGGLPNLREADAGSAGERGALLADVAKASPGEIIQTDQ